MQIIEAPSHREMSLPSYVIPEDALSMGPSFGNASIWVNTKGTGAIERIFRTSLGEALFGAVAIRYGIAADVVRPPWNHAAGASLHYVPVQCEDAAMVEIHPAYQRRRSTMAAGVRVAETTLVPLAQPFDATAEPPVAFIDVHLHNDAQARRRLRIVAYARLRGSLEPDLRARYEPRVGGLVAAGRARPRAVRIFSAEPAPESFTVTRDSGRFSDPTHLHPLDGETFETGDVLGGLAIDVILEPGEERRVAFAAAAYDLAPEDAVEAHAVLPSAQRALDATIAHLRECLDVTQVLTPDPEINAGALWSKVNMRRVMAAYPQGPGFTNEPGVSSNIVGRDDVWFVYGNDHFIPDFSRHVLDKLAEVQYESGKIPEYYNAIDGHREDDGLNINDDTPLFILGVNHHARASGDLAWLNVRYPAVLAAADYIISQTDERGLVFCNARDPRGNVWAIASWRNVIAGYSINGAVTEINAECVAALRAAAHMAENMGRPAAEIEKLCTASETIRFAMDRHLRNPENGLYFLNIDADGFEHTDVTGDLVFPAMFRACDDETALRIIRRLNAPDFWTTAGLRTISRQDPLYDPNGNIGLLGGVWPGLTWWYAFAAGRHHPEFMVRALRASFVHYAADPKNKNTVPGQFGEYFDGESLVNRGMRLSPWEPPRFLWAAVEGVCGLILQPGAPRVAPLVPATWKWVALRRVPYHGGELSYFAVREGTRFRLYATTRVESTEPAERFTEDVTPLVTAFSSQAAVIALRAHGRIVILVGNVAAETTTVALDLLPLIERDATYALAIYDSELGAWESAREHSGSELCALAFTIEPEGCRLLELRW